MSDEAIVVEWMMLIEYISPRATTMRLALASGSPGVDVVVC
jgi:hypothetical protein